MNKQQFVLRLSDDRYDNGGTPGNIMFPLKEARVYESFEVGPRFRLLEDEGYLGIGIVAVRVTEIPGETKYEDLPIPCQDFNAETLYQIRGHSGIIYSPPKPYREAIDVFKRKTQFGAFMNMIPVCEVTTPGTRKIEIL